VGFVTAQPTLQNFIERRARISEMAGTKPGHDASA
jgi:hypothetical protein